MIAISFPLQSRSDSLESGEGPVGVNFHSTEEFGEQLNGTPPSLYLFQKGEDQETQNIRAIKEGVVHADAIVRPLDPILLGSSARIATRCYYLEFRQTETDDYSRTVFVEG